MKKTVTIALETGIYGGSLCLLNNGKEISGWIGQSDQTKSRNFLESIKGVLHSSQIDIREVDEIVISSGPGSYTGLRVGYSIAKGLSSALGINIRGVSLLDVMLKDARPITVAAVPFGKTEICWKVKEDEKSNTPLSENLLGFSSQINFTKVVKNLNPDRLVLPIRLHKELSGSLEPASDKLKIIHCNENLACLLGKSRVNLISDEEVKLFYPKPFKTE